MTKDEILTAIAVIILLFSAMIDWNIYSGLILVGIVVFLFAWYFRKKQLRGFSESGCLCVIVMHMHARAAQFKQVLNDEEPQAQL